MNGKRTSPDQLNKLRREAVRLRLEKHTLKEISVLTGLTRPTIIAAYKRFVSGGWAAIETAQRGSPKGTKATKIAAKGLSDTSTSALLDELLASPTAGEASKPFLWSLQTLAQWLEQRTGQTFSPRTVARYASQWGFSQPARAATADIKAARTWVEANHPKTLERLQDRRNKLLLAGITAIKPEGHDTKGHMIYARDLRGKTLWLTRPRPIDATDIENFLERLTSTYSAPITLLFKGPSLAGYADIQRWLNSSTLTLITLPMAEGLESFLAAERTSISMPTTSQT